MSEINPSPSLDPFPAIELEAALGALSDEALEERTEAAKASYIACEKVGAVGEAAFWEAILYRCSHERMQRTCQTWRWNTQILEGEALANAEDKLVEAKNTLNELFKCHMLPDPAAALQKIKKIEIVKNMAHFAQDERDKSLKNKEFAVAYQDAPWLVTEYDVECSFWGALENYCVNEVNRRLQEERRLNAMARVRGSLPSTKPE